VGAGSSARAWGRRSGAAGPIGEGREGHGDDDDDRERRDRRDRHDEEGEERRCFSFVYLHRFDLILKATSCCTTFSSVETSS
jgi:hypothetical protein